LHHVGSLYILTYDAWKIKPKIVSREWATRIDIYKSSMVPTTGLRGMYFLPMTIGVRKVVRDKAETNHKAAFEFKRSPLRQMLDDR
jgi:hypothetical protein